MIHEGERLDIQEHHPSPGHLDVRLAGNLTGRTAEAFRSWLAPTAARAERFTVDAWKIETVDFTGVAILLAFARDFGQRRATFRLRGASASLRERFELAGPGLLQQISEVSTDRPNSPAVKDKETSGHHQMCVV